MEYTLNDWIFFNVVVFVLLFIDLWIFSKTKTMSFKSSIFWCCAWVSLAILFGGYIYYRGGFNDALDYFAAYMVEYTLSVDNLFIFLVTFSYFHVPKAYTHPVLFWGIVGAIVMRATFIYFGILIVSKFYWVLYIFGLFLIFTAYKLIANRGKQIDPGNNPIIKFARRYLPMTDDFHEDKFFVRINGVLKATPLFLVLLVIEASDVLFALDSIPAVMGITLNPFIVYTSNIAAILGLRSLYFSMDYMKDSFHYLDEALAIILGFIGVKMLTHHYIDLPNWLTFGFVIVVLAVSITLSLLYPQKNINND
jgi:tellurite resistance protein TerC